MRSLGRLLPILPVFLICGNAKGAQEDIIVNGQRPFLTPGGWKIDEGLWRAGGWQSRHGERTLFYCVGKEDIDRLLIVMMGGRDSERSPLCNKVQVKLRKGKIVARWSCYDRYAEDVTLTAPYKPDNLDATIESTEHGGDFRNVGKYVFVRHSKAQYISSCPPNKAG